MMAPAYHDVVIRQVWELEEFAQRVTVWRSAVAATHEFLLSEHRQSIELGSAEQYVPHVLRVAVVWHRAGWRHIPLVGRLVG